MKIYYGVLEGFAETGTEGFCWALYDDETSTAVSSYTNLRLIEDGDKLTVFGDHGAVLFDDIIKCDNSVKEVLGLRIHWVQSGMPAEKWVDMFVGHELNPPSRFEALRAKLVVMHHDWDMNDDKIETCKSCGKMIHYGDEGWDTRFKEVCPGTGK